MRSGEIGRAAMAQRMRFSPKMTRMFFSTSQSAAVRAMRRGKGTGLSSIS